MVRRLITVVVLLIALQGCSGSHSSPQALQDRWNAAVQRDEPAALFALLDTGSRYRLERDLNVIRGLDESARYTVVQQINHPDVTEVDDMTPARYFEVLWRRTIGEQKPTAEVKMVDTFEGFLIISMGNRSERFEMVQEGGRWAWRLPTGGDDAMALSAVDVRP